MRTSGKMLTGTGADTEENVGAEPDREAREGKRRGYLLESFRFFHLRDQVALDIEPHYHEFDKLIIFLSGNAAYLIEGRAYSLKPWDILLVGRYDLHKPVIDTAVPYERVVIWLKPEFMERRREKLSECFRLTQQSQVRLLRPESALQQRTGMLLAAMEEELRLPRYGSETMAEAYMEQLLILISRALAEGSGLGREAVCACDEQIEQILTYINANLSNELSVAALAERFYISESHLMHKFKRETGYSVHRYIKTKRLLLAAGLLRQGKSATEAGLACGFREYSAFSRAFYQMYGSSPGRFLEKDCQMSEYAL